MASSGPAKDATYPQAENTIRIHGQDLTNSALRSLVGATSQVVGIRRATLDDGTSNGLRVAEARTAGGFDITCLVDRALDVADASIVGLPLCWKAPTGFAGPWFFEPTEMGLERTVGGGLFFTAGLDHALFPVRETEPEYAYPHIGDRLYPMHGRIGHTPARLIEVLELLDVANPRLRIRGLAEQASLFGEYLELDRTIETSIGIPLMTVTDVVTNRGGTPAPHMMLYHINFGFPLLAPGALPFGSPIIRTSRAPATDAGEVPFAPVGDPVPLKVEQVFCHQLEPDADDWCHVGVLNPDLGLAVGVSYDSLVMPHVLEWRVERAGIYALGFEPSTADLGGRTGARSEGSLRYLDPGESVTYRLVFRAVRTDDMDVVTRMWM